MIQWRQLRKSIGRTGKRDFRDTIKIILSKKNRPWPSKSILLRPQRRNLRLNALTMTKKATIQIIAPNF